MYVHCLKKIAGTTKKPFKETQIKSSEEEILFINIYIKSIYSLFEGIK